MKILMIFVACLCFMDFAFSQTNHDFLKFKPRIGFDDTKERVVAKRFSDDGTKLTLIGLFGIVITHTEQHTTTHEN